MMKINKREKRHRFNNDTVVDIPVYGPHDMLGPQDYIVPQLIAEFESGFEVKCKQWLKKAKPDMYNRGYMDMLINKLEKEAISQLDVQRVTHESAVYELAKVWEGDRLKAEAKLKEIEIEKRDLDTDIVRLEKIYYKGTAFDTANSN